MFVAFRAMLRDPEAKALVAAAAGVIVGGSLVYMVLEHWSPIDAVYFCVVTLATIGFGDLAPKTDAGKLFTVVYVLGSIGIIAAFIAELAKHRPSVQRLSEDRADAAVGSSPAIGTSRPSPSAGDAPPVIDARSAPRDPASPRTDIGPGG